MKINYQLSISQALLALQTFSMIMTINLKSDNSMDFSYFSGLMVLVPTTLILCKVFLIDPTLIFEDNEENRFELDKEKCLTLIAISLFATGLLSAWNLLFNYSIIQNSLIAVMFFLSNIGEGTKFYVLTFSEKKITAIVNMTFILASTIVQQFYISDFIYCLVIFYIQSFPFLFVFVSRFIASRMHKVIIDSKRLKETFIQGLESVLAFLELFIIIWILRSLSQSETLINFQQSIILIAPLNSLANFLSLGVYRQLLNSNHLLVRVRIKRILISIALLYLVAVLIDPFDLVEMLIRHGEVSSSKEWFVVQILASCFTLFVLDRYYELKENKFGNEMLKARSFEIVLIVSILILCILTQKNHLLAEGFLVGMVFATCNWIRVSKRSRE